MLVIFMVVFALLLAAAEPASLRLARRRADIVARTGAGAPSALIAMLIGYGMLSFDALCFVHAGSFVVGFLLTIATATVILPLSVFFIAWGKVTRMVGNSGQ
jgi:hypothetical protein